MKNTKKGVIILIVATIATSYMLIGMFTLLQPPVAKATSHKHGYRPIQILLPTCSRDGYVKRECSCGETETEKIPALEHSYKSVIINPTCTEQGYTTHICLICEDFYIDSYVDALGHNYEWVVDKPATETETCTKHEECLNCGDKRDEDTAIEIP